MNSPSKIAEEVLRIFYGGKIRTNNSEWDERMVQVMVSQERDYVVKSKVDSDFIGGKPIEDSMFTSFEGQLQWDEAALVDYLDLPAGYLSIDDDRGIRIVPTVVNGENPFRRVPSGTLFGGTKLWAEGNILWMVRPPRSGGKRRIIFMNMPARNMKVNYDVIIGDSTADPSAAVGIPDGLETVVIDRVLRKMGFRRMSADKQNDNVDNPQGSGTGS